jgi:hypothetical protein
MLHFAQMLRARSEFFREKTVAHSGATLFGKVEKVFYKLGGENFDKLQSAIKYQSFDEILQSARYCYALSPSRTCGRK